MPDDITCIIYHPLTLNGTPGTPINNAIKTAIMEFIKLHDCTDSGNITELAPESLERFLSVPCYVGILRQKEKIIGTMFTVLLRVGFRQETNSGELQHESVKEIEILTSYTTFLCIDKSFRDKGLAMALIRSIMKAGETQYGSRSGYYMTYETHHTINNKIESWYRPLNVKRAVDCGFVLESFARKGDRVAAIRQKMAYHIPKPSIIPRKVNVNDYRKVLPILKRGRLYLNPTLKEFGFLCKCFDIYIVERSLKAANNIGSDGLFMLFPMTSVISSTKKRVYNAQLAYMIGDLLPSALWVANNEEYDLMYGWCGGDITVDRVRSVRGLITTAASYVEFYNVRELIPNNQLMLPLF